MSSGFWVTGRWLENRDPDTTISKHREIIIDEGYGGNHSKLLVSRNRHNYYKNIKIGDMVCAHGLLSFGKSHIPSLWLTYLYPVFGSGWSDYDQLSRDKLKKHKPKKKEEVIDDTTNDLTGYNDDTPPF